MVRKIKNIAKCRQQRLQLTQGACVHVVSLQVVCRVFGVQATVIVLFGDRRAHVLNCISHLGHQVGLLGLRPVVWWCGVEIVVCFSQQPFFCWSSSIAIKHAVLDRGFTATWGPLKKMTSIQYLCNTVCVLHQCCLPMQEGGVPWRWGQCGWMMSSEAHQLLVVDDMLDDAR